jgi:hypothetical protein
MLPSGEKHEFSGWKLAFDVNIILRDYTKPHPVSDGCLKERGNVGEHILKQLVLDFSSRRYLLPLSISIVTSLLFSREISPRPVPDPWSSRGGALQARSSVTLHRTLLLHPVEKRWPPRALQCPHLEAGRRVRVDPVRSLLVHIPVFPCPVWRRRAIRLCPLRQPTQPRQPQHARHLWHGR